VRPAAVAGSFYPADPRRLESIVDRCLAAAGAATGTPRALVAPHAGYVYSGPIAGTAYAQLAELGERVRRVVLLGPAHRLRFEGIAVSDADAFETPLGRVPLDAAARERALELPQVRRLEAAHAQEHSLEVQLPFLQRVLREFRLVPFAVGDASGEEVAELVEALWQDEETFVVVSSDLSHYLPYEEARRVDAATCRAIEELRPEAIAWEQACGRVPLQGLLQVARRRGLRASTLDLRSSGDTAGGRDEVVGYGAWSFA
jgi:AmmeMemoRadiSam system protein B